MRLSYRSASYEYTPPTLEVKEQEILAHPSQSNWRCKTLAESGLLKPSTPSPVRGAGKAIRQAPIPTTPAIREELSQMHRANINRSLERRLKVAHERGDTALIQMLEAERRQTVLH